METREEGVVDKQKLLAIGDRYDAQIAENRNKDAAYR